jgi:hypothetical protein
VVEGPDFMFATGAEKYRLTAYAAMTAINTAAKAAAKQERSSSGS